MPARFLVAWGRSSLAAALLLAFTPTRAWSCGVSGGSAVGVSSCSIEEHEEQMRRRWRVGVGYGFASTAVKFDDFRFDETRHSALATVDYAPTRRWTFELGVGSLLSGRLERAGVNYDFQPGVLAMLGASWRVLDADGARPFVLLQDQLAFATTSTREGGSDSSPSIAYTALDMRLGGLVGWTFKNVVSAYALARVFGGPIFWQYQGDSLTGTDVHHYQLGAGLVVLIARRLDLSIEGAPLGERSLSAAAGFAF